MTVAEGVGCLSHARIGLVILKKSRGLGHDSNAIRSDELERSGLNSLRAFSHFAQYEDWNAKGRSFLLNPTESVRMMVALFIKCTRGR